MRKKLYFIQLALLTSLFANLAWSETDDLERGRLLYENHCRSCHESGVHIRNNHKAQDRHEVYLEVARWSEELQLTWQHREINDVSYYLYRTFYIDKMKD